MATSIAMPFSRLLPAVTLVAAGFFLSGGGAETRPAEPARSTRPAEVTYCSGCLCDDTPPQMSVPGAWLPSGGMLAGRIVLKFVPRDQDVRVAGSCGRAPRA